MTDIIEHNQNIISVDGDQLAFGYSDPSQNPAFAYLASLSEGSRRAMRQALASIVLLASGEEMPKLKRGEAEGVQNGLIASFGWHQLTPAHVTAIRGALAEKFAHKTANKTLAALRGTIRQSWRAGYIDAETMQRMIDFKPVPGQNASQAVGRSLTAGELMMLINECRADSSPAGVRDMAIIAVAYFGGLRRSEIATINVEDYNVDTAVLTVTGKRNKTRTVPVPLASDEINAWLEIRGQHNGPMFVSVERGGVKKSGDWWGYKLGETAITDQAIYTIFQKRAEDAGVKKFSPHDMRRTFVSDMLDAGVDLGTASAMAGHANPATTARYDRNTERRKDAAARKMTKPW